MTAEQKKLQLCTLKVIFTAICSTILNKSPRGTSFSMNNSRQDVPVKLHVSVAETY